MKNLESINGVVGSGKTEKIINECNNNSLIVTYTHSLSNYIKDKCNNKCNIINYHQLIYQTGKKIGMPLLNGEWSQYENEFIFEKKKDRITQKYSKIFVDFADKDKTDKWIKILKRYFLAEEGKIYFTSETAEKTSFRINGNIAEFIKNTLNKEIIVNQTTDHRKHIVNYYSNANIETLRELIYKTNFNGETTTILVHTKELQNQIENSIRTLNSSNEGNRKLWKISGEEINLTTIENFKGLESDNIILILTEDVNKDNLYSALTRAKNKLFILNFDNLEYRDIFKIFADNIMGKENHNPYKDNLYISLLPTSIKILLQKLYIDESDNIEDDNIHKTILEKKFNKIFPNNQELIFFNYDNNLTGLTTDDTDLVLLVKEENQEDKNYFLCGKVIKNKFLLNEKNSIRVKSNLIYKIHPSEMETSFAKVNNASLTIQELIKKVQKKETLKPITESKEYKKWETYLKIERLRLEKEETITFEIELKQDKEKNNFIYFEKPTNKVTIEKNSEIIISKDGTKIGKVKEIEKNKFYLVNVDSKIKKEKQTKHKVFVSKEQELWNIKQLENGLNQILFNDYKYYIFDDKKLPSIDDWENIDIDFINQNLNKKQKEAIKKAIASKEMFLIQGPPGTGKTTVISELAQYYLKNNQTVLITSESNDAIDNAIERLNKDNLYPYIHQSANRQEQTLYSDKLLPITAKLGEFYKQRTINKLNDLILNYKDNREIIEELELEKEIKIEEIDLKIKEALSLDNPYINLNKEEIKNKGEKDKKEITLTINSKIDTLKKDSIFIDIQKEFLEELKNNSECDKEFKISYENKINIEGVTLLSTSTSKYRNKKYDVVIVDEISKSTPLQLNLALLKAKKIILIGDHKQLPPILTNSNETLREWAEDISTNLEEDIIFEEILSELKENKTVFQKLIENNSDNFIQLTTQYRMHPKIQEAINQFYDEDLECGINENKRKNKHKLFESKNLVWVDNNSKEQQNAKKSFYNSGEIEKIEKILQQLNKEYENISLNENQKKPKIGVISFYSAQVNKLKSIATNNNFKNLEIDFGTVDSFQGQERDFIICSMVRSNEKKDIGFAKSLNRINVAFSRAKQLLIIVGSKKTFTEIKISPKNLSKNEIKSAKRKYKNIYNIAYKGEI